MAASMENMTCIALKSTELPFQLPVVVVAVCRDSNIKFVGRWSRNEVLRIPGASISEDPTHFMDHLKNRAEITRDIIVIHLGSNDVSRFVPPWKFARSSYADMLHDTERNQLYYKALAKAIKKLCSRDLPVNVLDIGTGTGLLAMMAARLGADTVHACEAFEPIADCARKIIQLNGFGEKIKLISKRSTEVTVGEGEDMAQKANILVTEVFDTELIGEGAISTFTHAHRELLEKDCIVVPSIGNMYVQPVTSDFVRKWTQIEDIVVNASTRITSPDSISTCGGAPSLHDLQLDQLPENKFKILSEPLRVFRFDFTGKSPLPFSNTSCVTTGAVHAGSVDAVFMWWDLEMDEEGEIILSCAPRWAHPTPTHMQWRDHWMQAIYYPYTRTHVTPGDTMRILSKHDEYSLWFDVAKDGNTSIKESLPQDRPVCTCRAHIAFSRSKMGMLSDPARRTVFIESLRKHLTKDSVCLCVSDGSLLPLVAASLGARRVYTLEPNPLCNGIIRDFVKCNGLQDVVTVLDKRPEDLTMADFDNNKIDVVIGEPTFQTSLLPWHNMYLWYTCGHLSHSLAPGATVLPRGMTVYGVPVNYAHLCKIRANVGVCEGFNLRQFDELIESTSDQVDASIEPQPLWEYPCLAVSEPGSLLQLDFTKPVADTADITHTTSFLIQHDEPCNGMALWADFDFGDGRTISTGPREQIRVGEPVKWDWYTRQGVHLFKQHKGITDRASITAEVNFKPQSGELAFKFNPSWL